MGGCGLRAARRVADRSCVSTGGPCGPSGRGAAPQHVGVPRACGPAARDTMRGPGLRRGCGELGAGRADGLGGGPGRGSSEAGPRPPGRARARPGECRLRGWRCQRLGCAGRVRPGVPPVPAPASGQARGPAAPDVGRGSDRGVLAVEDADLEGLFCDPDNDGFTFYRRMYAEVLARSGGDPGCGHRLPRYFREIGIRTHPCAEPLWKMIMKSGLVAGVQLRAGCG